MWVCVRVSRYDWVQIVEPLSRHYIYINLETGECLWDPPKDVRLYVVLRTGIYTCNVVQKWCIKK